MALRQRRSFFVPLVVGLALLIVGAQAADRASSDQLVEQARLGLALVEDESDRVLAATELVLGLHAHGHTESAQALVTGAQQQADAIADTAGRAGAFIAIAETLIQIEDAAAAGAALREARAATDQLSERSKQWDLRGKILVAEARGGGAQAALAAARAMPEEDETLAAYKSRTLHDIAPAFAEHGELDTALETLASITMGMSYYRVAATADVVAESYNAQNSPTLSDLLIDAAATARAQSDGYFVAGALRHLAVAYAHIGDTESAASLFDEALKASLNGASPQHRARAISRVATAMADLGFFEEAIAALPAAMEQAREETREPFRFFALYEIAGSTAFSGDRSTAIELLEEIPEDFAFGKNTLRWAAQRDVAWGMARHGHTTEALDLAMAIPSLRERVQALSRILRLQADPDMIALPRYL